MPAKPTIPSPVINTETSIPVAAKPRNTPMTLKIISLRIITGLLTLLNCKTKISKMVPKAIINALPRNAPVSACCSPSPVCLMVTPSATPLKLSIYPFNTWFTPVALYPRVVNTLETRLIKRFSFLRLTLPSVLEGSIVTNELIGIFLMAPPDAKSLKYIFIFNNSERFWR